MSSRRKLTTAAILTLVALLVLAPTAFAAAGGGSAGFSGAGGFSGGGGVHGGGRGFALYIVIRLLIDIALIGHGIGLLVLIGLALLYWFVVKVVPGLQAAAEARRESGRAQERRTRHRERRVELAAAEAADENPLFDPEQVRTSAADLFVRIQQAWDQADRVQLRGLVAPTLLAEWERRLDDLDGRGWRNRVEPLEPPDVRYVGLARHRGPDDPDRVVVRIESRMRDYVVDRTGRHLRRRGQFTETVRLREFWTLERRDDHWILASIEQGAEGAHALSDQVRATEWSDESALRDEAVLQLASDDAVPAGTDISQLADLQFTGEARAAANDLSLADGRFAPDVLEAAARQAVAAWAEAVDGPDDRLRQLAEPAAVNDLLYPGDPSRQTRLVVRGPTIQQIEIVGLDAQSQPPTMTIDVSIDGRRYLQDRATTRVVTGDPARVSRFTERWTLGLTADRTQPWRIVSVQTPAVA